MAHISNGVPASEPFTKARLGKPMSELLQELYEKAALQRELKTFSSVLRVDYAHIIMLTEVGLISGAQAGVILQELDELRKAGPDQFITKPGHGSIALQIENHLCKRLGQDTAGRLPIARSRIDHSATVRRISDRNAALNILRELLTLQKALAKRAEVHGDTAVISYTHMQQAQPATFGHYLLAFKDRLDDAFHQLTQAYGRIDRCPLGAVGLSGTDIPIDRKRTASLLGFAELLDNSRLGRDAYYQIEFVFVLSLIMTILNDLCTELHIQSSTEFGTVELDDSHCSTSSVFPQKKNPVALEIIKGKAGEAQGWVTAALAAFRNEGTGDQQSRYVACLSNACVTTVKMMRLATEIVQRLTINELRCRELLSQAWVTTNRLGNILLTKHGLNYRSAHGVVGRLVKNCMNEGLSKQDVTVDMLQKAAGQMGVGNIPMSQDELVSSLNHVDFISSCISLGSIGPEQFQRLLAIGKEKLQRNHSWLEEKQTSLVIAEEELERAAKQLRDVLDHV